MVCNTYSKQSVYSHGYTYIYLKQATWTIADMTERENKNALKLQKGKKNDKEDTFTHMKNTFINLKH